MSDDIAFMPVTELVAAFRAKSVTPTQAMRAALDRISAHDDRVNGICYLDEEGALAAAAASDARWERGAPKGLVDGVPISVKDTLNVKGMPTRQGSKTADPNPVAADAAAVARMREHGAIIFGKNTTPEYGTGPSTVNPLTGVTRNPWNLDKSPGGSSGGAAAVVAAGIGQASLGTDAGGSIRIPCALCGLVGLKATLARVAVYPPMVVPVLSTTGALARTVDDAALMLNVLSQRDGRDFQELAPDGVDYTRGLNDGIRGLRVAYSATLGFAPRVDSEVADIVAKAAHAFTDLGATVEEKDPGFEDPHGFMRVLVNAGVAFKTREVPEENRALMSDSLRASIETGRNTSAVEYLVAMDARAKIFVHMQHFHETYDLLLTPTTAAPAFTAERFSPEDFEKEFGYIRAWTPFCYPFSLTQQAAVTVPCGFTKAGLPVGLQIVGPKFADALVLRAAKAYETAYPTTDRRPPL